MADPRSIHEFTTGEVEATTLLLGDFVDLDAQSGYTTYKMSVSDIGEVILEDIEYTQDLQTVDKTIIGAINENKSVIGYSYDEYDPTTAYSKDDLCIYNNTLYKALQATTGNLPTNTTYWELTSIANEINNLNDKFTYSSNEEIIGKWTDGKSIYRKILTGTVANNTVDLSVGEKIDTCINYSLLVNKNGINFKAPYRMEDGNNYYQVYCFCNNASGNTNSNIYATFASSTADYFNGCDVTCIVEYTKRS